MIDIFRVEVLPLLLLIFNGLARLGRMIFSGVVSVVSLITVRAPKEPLVPAPTTGATKQAHAVARISVPAASLHLDAGDGDETGPQTVFVQDWDIADLIVTIGLDPNVGKITLRVFYSRRLVKRDIVISEPRLRKLLGGMRRLELPDVPYDPLVGLEDIKAQTVEEAEERINRQGNERIRGVKPPRANIERTRETPMAAKVPAPALQERAVAPASVPPASTSASIQAQQPETAAAKPAPRLPDPTAIRSVDGKAIRSENVTYTGSLVAAGTAWRRPKGRPPFETFDAEIRLEDGTNLTLSGAELERALEKQQVALGDRVAITTMGKVPVQLANGGSGMKNLFKVEVLERKRG